MIRKQKFRETFEQLFLLCSVEILRQIEATSYGQLYKSETYKDEEKNKMEKTAKESAEEFARDVFQEEE